MQAFAFDGANLIEAARTVESLIIESASKTIWFLKNFNTNGQDAVVQLLSELGLADDISDLVNGISKTITDINSYLQHSTNLGYEFFKILGNTLYREFIDIILWKSPFDSLRSLFSKAEVTRSPILLDLDGDGVIKTLGTDAGIHFDHDGNGFKELSGWVAPGDGVLMLDRDLDDILDNGSELFGNFTPFANGMLAVNGFQALAQFDANGDGKIDASDPIWSQLKIWQHDPEATDSGDPDSSGILTTLDDLGIQSINTGYANSTFVDANGNAHKEIGSFTWNNGTTNSAEDIWFQTDNMFTIANEWVDVPEDIAALPDLQGYGNVYDLQQAMAKEALSGQQSGVSLKSLVEQFASETDSDARHSLITQILYKWTGVENIDPLSRAATKIYGNVIGDARKLATLEAFMGEGYVGTWCWGERDPNPHGPASKILLRAFDELADSIYSQLMAQTHFKDLMGTISMTWNDETQQVEWDVSATPEALQSLYITNPDNAPLAMSEFGDILKLAGDTGQKALEDLRAMGDPTGDGFLQLLSVMGMNTTIGNASNNTLQGTNSNDALYGMGGNDNLYGNAGNDILDGGTGDDYLVGGTGNDSYIFNRGNGQETIFDDDSTAGNTDTIRFGSGILPSDITFTRSGYDLILGVKNTSDQLTIHGWGVMQAYRIERIEFADGTVWDAAQIQTRIPVIVGTANDDTLFAWEGDAAPPKRAGRQRHTLWKYRQRHT